MILLDENEFDSFIKNNIELLFNSFIKGKDYRLVESFTQIDLNTSGSHRIISHIGVLPDGRYISKTMPSNPSVQGRSDGVFTTYSQDGYPDYIIRAVPLSHWRTAFVMFYYFRLFTFKNNSKFLCLGRGNVAICLEHIFKSFGLEIELVGKYFQNVNDFTNVDVVFSAITEEQPKSYYRTSKMFEQGVSLVIDATKFSLRNSDYTRHNLQEFPFLLGKGNVDLTNVISEMPHVHINFTGSVLFDLVLLEAYLKEKRRYAGIKL